MMWGLQKSAVDTCTNNYRLVFKNSLPICYTSCWEWKHRRSVKPHKQHINPSSLFDDTLTQ